MKILTNHNQAWQIVSEAINLYDKNKIIQELINLIKLEKTYNKEEKAEELMESSNSFELENRRLLLESIKILSDIATESAQIFLLINNKFILYE